jgi:3-phosphoshikimate 1-carboxyvinyltransferase
MKEESKRILPHPEVSGRITVPGDKSISHRAVLISAICRGESRISNFLTSEDCNGTLRAVDNLGARSTVEPDCISIQGLGSRLNRSAAKLDMGNSGTGMRLISGLLAGQDFESELTGDESLLKRPMRRIQEPLQLMGARVELLGGANRPPIRIKGGTLRSIEYDLPVPSAQVKSCIMLAALYAEGKTVIIEPKVSRDHTERMLCALGAPVSCDELKIQVEGFGSAGPRFEARDWHVPGDFSSAAFWFAAAACGKGGSVTVPDVGLNPGRKAFLDVLMRMGARVETDMARNADGSEPWEPTGTVKVTGAGMSGTRVGGSEIPCLIDELPLVAVCGAIADGETEIRDAEELRVKECDRIGALRAGLSEMGVPVEEFNDGLKIHGGGVLHGDCRIDSCGDHRIAMAFAVLSLFAQKPVEIRNVACVATSYPSFWRDLDRLCQDKVVESKQ